MIILLNLYNKHNKFFEKKVKIMAMEAVLFSSFGLFMALMIRK
jgi:uncharacterized protein YacL